MLLVSLHHADTIQYGGKLLTKEYVSETNTAAIAVHFLCA